ncbi:MAG: DUF192 domain-containing protein [Bacteriovoracaceae bacterium]|nr:DUF192 domain-containing protein [Bacteriovoracaceae bacterium]
MKHFITIISLQFIVFLTSCHAENKLDPFKLGALTLESGERVELEIVYSDKDHSRGLSARKSESLGPNKGMLFYYSNMDLRRFWMPDTYFDLDIFFLSSNFKVIEIARNMKAHPGLEVPPAIGKTPTVMCRHVLEMRSGDPLSKAIKIGATLKWTGKISIEKVESNLKMLKGLLNKH